MVEWAFRSGQFLAVSALPWSHRWKFHFTRISARIKIVYGATTQNFEA
jgi:hypothetical protein